MDMRFELRGEHRCHVMQASHGYFVLKVVQAVACSSRGFLVIIYRTHVPTDSQLPRVRLSASQRQKLHRLLRRGERLILIASGLVLGVHWAQYCAAAAAVADELAVSVVMEWKGFVC